MPFSCSRAQNLHLWRFKPSCTGTIHTRISPSAAEPEHRCSNSACTQRTIGHHNRQFAKTSLIACAVDR